MLRTKIFNSVRAFHITSLLFKDVEKNALSALRKKTGYTFANCKKALQLHNNNLELAEKWLHEQAQSLGWSKASKVANRVTQQGLIGVLVRGNIGAMVEINCETDFVARNENFRNFVDHCVRICAMYTEATQFDGDLWKLGFEVAALRKLRTTAGKTLGDDLAMLIGNVGENATIKRATCFKTNNDMRLAAYAHPAPSYEGCLDNVTQLGKYGALVAFRGVADKPEAEELQRNICQHIVGLSPRKVGDFIHDEPVENKDDETCLIHQEYIFDPDKTVGELLEENNISVIDYQRFEVGEVVKKNYELEQAKLHN